MASLAGVLPELARRELALRQAASARGIVYAIADFGGVRSEADTAKIIRYRDADYAVYVRELKAKRPTAIPLSKYVWRPINAYGTSMHNFGAAFDVVMIRGTIEQLAQLAPSAGLVWGGTFARKDTPHFQLPITLLQAKAAWMQLGNAPGVAGGVAARAATLGVQVAAVMAFAFIAGLAFLPGARSWG